MKLTITKTSRKTITYPSREAYLNRLLCDNDDTPEFIIEYFKMFPDITIYGSRYCYNDAITLLCSPCSDMSTDDIIKVLDYLLLTNDVNARSGNGSTPLLVAVYTGDLQLVKYLVSKGAKFIINGKLIRSDDTRLNLTRMSCESDIYKFVKECIFKDVTAV